MKCGGYTNKTKKMYMYVYTTDRFMVGRTTNVWLNLYETLALYNVHHAAIIVYCFYITIMEQNTISFVYNIYIYTIYSLGDNFISFSFHSFIFT